jgi:hypothetical protein
MKLILFFVILSGSLLSAPYEDKGDGTVLDTATKLLWQKCGDGQNELTCEGKGVQNNWSNAGIYCAQLKLAGKQWRLPTKEEIFGLLDLSQPKDPYIDGTAFPNTIGYRYWSNTPYVKNPSVVWTTHFYYGEEKRSKKEEKGYVRCVTK